MATGHWGLYYKTFLQTLLLLYCIATNFHPSFTFEGKQAMKLPKVSSGGIFICLDISDYGVSEWQWQTLAYYNTTVKSFRVQATGVQL